MQKISVDEFKNRLAAQCLDRGGRGLPRKLRDKHILYKSILLMLEPDRDYSEKEINAALEKWLTDVGQAIEIDHVSLRRHLVDEGYLSRDQAGTAYRVHLEPTADLFEPATDSIDPVTVIEEAVKSKEQKKRQRLDKRDDSST
jgi:hypothetical protein